MITEDSIHQVLHNLPEGMKYREFGGKPAAKPPLGIMPEHLWREQRIWELIRALARYDEAKMEVPGEWFAELRSHLIDKCCTINQP